MTCSVFAIGSAGRKQLRVDIAQLPLEKFSAWVFGQRVGKDDPFRRLEARQNGRGVRENLGLSQRLA